MLIELTLHEKCIKIAETCGIFICSGCNHKIDPNCCHCGTLMVKHGYEDGHSGIPIGCTCGYCDADKRRALVPECPNYFDDLNAIFKAWEDVAVTDDQESNYYKLLFEITLGRNPVCESDYWFSIQASAAQRAEAFGKALNLW